VKALVAQGLRRVNLPGLLTIFALAVAWQVAIRSGAVDFQYLPAPSAIFRAWWDLLLSGEMLAQTAHTFGTVLIGWTIASVIGVALGLALGISSVVRRYCQASLEVLRPLPAIAFLPVALLLFNFSLTTELVVTVYASVWPVLINTMGGIMGVGARLHDVCRTLRLSRRQAIVKVLLPAAAPAIVVGCRLGMGLALVMAIIAEMLGNPRGLGYAIVSELEAMQPERMFAYVLFIGVLGIALNAALMWVSARLLRGHAWAPDNG
jgi:sulfonate transport system permease protein